MSNGLSMMMVLLDFLLRCITPRQDHARPAWMYTREGNTTRLERGHYSDLDLDMLGALLGRLSPDLFSVDFITPLAVYAPICSDLVTWMRLLRELPTLDDIDVAAWLRGDES
jgi:hypothetical protein